MTIILWVLFLSGGFLSGSVLYSKIIPKALAHKDVCALSDDGNPGAFNAFAHCGKGIGALCLVLDILKGFVPVLLASLFLDGKNLLFALVVAAPVLGHTAGVFNRFRGGKGIAVSFGVAAGLLPVTYIAFPLLAALYIFFSTAVKVKPNRIRSITVYSLFALLCGVLCTLVDGFPVAAGCVLLSAAVLARHIEFHKTKEEKTEA